MSVPVEAVPASPADPYTAYLQHVASESEPCKKHAESLQTLLKQREDLLAPAGDNASGAADQLGQQLHALNQKIIAEERALKECQLNQQPLDPPPTPPTVPRAKDGSEIPVEKLRSDYYPPVPPPPAQPTVPPPPAREAAYIDFLAAQAGDSPVLAEMLEDIRQLYADRREAALRYLSAREGVRPFIASQIFALSQRIQETAHGIQNAPEPTDAPQAASL